MSNVEQFEKAVTEAGAVALRIERKPQGEERLVIQTRGGLVRKEVALTGVLSTDIQTVTAAAKGIVATARRMTGDSATTLSAKPTSKSYTPVV